MTAPAERAVDNRGRATRRESIEYRLHQYRYMVHGSPADGQEPGRRIGEDLADGRDRVLGPRFESSRHLSCFSSSQSANSRPCPTIFARAPRFANLRRDGGMTSRPWRSSSTSLAWPISISATFRASQSNGPTWFSLVFVCVPLRSRVHHQPPVMLDVRSQPDGEGQPHRLPPIVPSGARDSPSGSRAAPCRRSRCWIRLGTCPPRPCPRQFRGFVPRQFRGCGSHFIPQISTNPHLEN